MGTVQAQETRGKQWEIQVSLEQSVIDRKSSLATVFLCGKYVGFFQPIKTSFTCKERGGS